MHNSHIIMHTHENFARYSALLYQFKFILHEFSIIILIILCTFPFCIVQWQKENNVIPGLLAFTDENNGLSIIHTKTHAPLSCFMKIVRVLVSRVMLMTMMIKTIVT